MGLEVSSENSGKIARNTFFLTGAFAVQKIFSFVYFAYIAREVGWTNIGKYIFALSYAGIFALFIEFGLGPVLTREVAKDPTRTSLYLRTILGIKCMLAFLAVVLMIGILPFLNRPWDSVQMVYLAAFIIILDTLTFSFYSVFRAFQVMKYEAIGVTIYQTIIVLSGTLFVRHGFSVQSLVIAVLLGSIFNFSYSLILLIRKTTITPRIHLDRKTAVFLLRIAVPFALAGFFFKFNAEIDKILITMINGESFTGWYGVANKLTLALTVIPGAIATSIFPAYSRYFVTDRTKLRMLFEQAMFYLMVVSLPITAAVLVFADTIILKVYNPFYQASIPILRILIAGLLFLFLNYPVGNLLNATNRQTINTVNMGIASVVNVILNIILIPQWNSIGAAIAAVTSWIILLILGLPWVWRITSFNYSFLLVKLAKILFASFTMGIMLLALRDQISFVLSAILGVLIYSTALFLTRGITPQELSHLIGSIRRKFSS